MGGGLGGRELYSLLHAQTVDTGYRYRKNLIIKKYDWRLIIMESRREYGSFSKLITELPTDTDIVIMKRDGEIIEWIFSLS